jgi:hypothetical protein
VGAAALPTRGVGGRAGALIPRGAAAPEAQLHALGVADARQIEHDRTAVGQRAPQLEHDLRAEGQVGGGTGRWLAGAAWRGAAWWSGSCWCARAHATISGRRPHATICWRRTLIRPRATSLSLSTSTCSTIALAAVGARSMKLLTVISSSSGPRQRTLLDQGHVESRWWTPQGC